MADLKISALTASTTPLAGTEVLPIVQSSTTKQVSVANLTAGRAISATELTLTTGNLIVASGYGIDFSATPGTGTSELLADYEEGTWTPQVFYGGTQVSYYNRSGTYTKIGRTVICQMNAYVTIVAGALVIKNLPFTAGASVTGGYGYVHADTPSTDTITVGGVGSGTTQCSCLYVNPGVTETTPYLTIIYTV